MRYIKICGIHYKSDALMCINQGANAVGVIVGALHKTEDALTSEKAREIFDAIKDPNIYKVLVTHIENAEEVHNLALLTGCNTIQIHSYMNLREIEQLRKKFPGTLIGIAHGNTVNFFDRFGSLANSELVDMILVDTRTSDRVGGTGKTHDWKLTARMREKYPDIKLIIAGGLTPDNVSDAIKMIRPFGVDVNSGVSLPSGIKDPLKVHQFVESAVNSWNIAV